MTRRPDAYKNTVYAMSKTSPERTAIALDMERFPLSMSEMQSWVVPSLSANSCCVHSILPRKPRKTIAELASGKTSLALTLGETSSSGSDRLEPAWRVLLP